MTTIQNRTGRLTREEYSHACALTQLNSIDLLIEDSDGRVLLGLRKNTPAKNTYFVPGSRVYKGETLKSALHRTMSEELGCVINDVKFYGVFEHYYMNDNPTGCEGVDTHYIIFAFKGKLPNDLNIKQFSEQHSDIRWMKPEELINDENVNVYTKLYYERNQTNRFL